MPLFQVGDVIVTNKDITARHGTKRAYTAAAGHLWTITKVIQLPMQQPRYELKSTESKGIYTGACRHGDVRGLAKHVNKKVPS